MRDKQVGQKLKSDDQATVDDLGSHQAEQLACGAQIAVTAYAGCRVRTYATILQEQRVISRVDASFSETSTSE